MKFSSALLTIALCLASAVAFAAPEKVVFWTSHTPPDSDILKGMVEKFNAANPDIQVQLVQVPGSETDIAKLMTAVRGGTGPDVYMLDRFTIAQRAASGVLEDISAQLKKIDPALSSKYLDFAWQETLYKGKSYGLPFDTDARVLYYRKDMVKAAGYDPAILDPKNGPITIDQLKEIAFKINKTDDKGNYSQVGFIPYATQYQQGWHYTWGYVFGGEFADIKAGKVTPTDPRIVKSFQWLYDWAKEMGPQKTQTFISTYTPPSNPPQQQPFVTGKVAFMVSGDWDINTMRSYAKDVDYGITYLPVVNKGDKPSSWSGGWSYVVPKGSKHLSAAVKFISWICGAEGQGIYLKEGSHLPTYKALLDDASLFSEKHQLFRSVLPFSHSRPVLPIGVLYWDSLTVALNQVALNEKSPEVALKAVEDQVQPQLKRYLPLK
jgi:multiple sugar transport system substrate-binding protein